MFEQLRRFLGRDRVRSCAWSAHWSEQISVQGDGAATFQRLKALLAKAVRTEIVMATDTHVHAVCRTRLGFADDLECRLCSAEGVIHLSSTSRVGLYDFSVNRRRIEALRQQLQPETAQSQEVL